LSENSQVLEQEKETPWKGVFELASIGIGVFIVILLVLSFVPNEMGDKSFELLNSNLVLTLIGAVVVPWFAKAAKDKVGLDISESEVAELLGAVRTAAELTRKEYDKYRDADGRIGAKGKEAKAYAIENIKSILGQEKYVKIVKRVGFQFIDKAIDEYVSSEWQERYKIEKDLIKELVKDTIDAIPQVKEWDNLSIEKREKLIEESVTNLEQLLDQVGIQGWGRNVLITYIKGELNRRTSL
jgi:hypothetical protein